MLSKHWLTIVVGLVRSGLITKVKVGEPDLTKPLRKNLLSAKTRVDESGSCYALGKRDHIIGGTHCCSANQLFLLCNLALKASSKSKSQNISSRSKKAAKAQSMLQLLDKTQARYE